MRVLSSLDPRTDVLSLTPSDNHLKQKEDSNLLLTNTQDYNQRIPIRKLQINTRRLSPMSHPEFLPAISATIVPYLTCH